MNDLQTDLARMALLPPRAAAEAARRDQEQRLRAGECVSAERYLDALPQVAASPEDALLVIYGEVLLRGPNGTVDLSRFRGRYPHLADQLAALADVHGALFVEGEPGEASRPADFPSTTPDARRPTTLPHPAAPAILGYEVVRLVGQGAMGVVWEARQLALNRIVALKVVRSADLAGPEELVRFLSEAEALAAVEHPHVVRVYDVGRDGNLPYMALEYVAGGSLADRLREGPLSAAEAARILEQLARGVQAAHERGIIHRDLKPGNVLLASPVASAPGEGRAHSQRLPPGADATGLAGCVAKVTDFGLARRVEAGTGLTQTGVVMGTPSYMAPEQARGDSKRVGPAADVYALGTILYECLTGRPPFVGPVVVDVLMQVVADEPVALRALAPKTPRDLETICHKCLHKEPTRRYASAAELADDLRRFQAGEPIAARPVGRAERAWKWGRRRPAVAGLLAVLVVAVAAAFAAVKSEQTRTAKQRDLAEENLARALEAEEVAKSNLEEALKAVDECFGLAKDDPRLQDEHLRGVRKLLLEKTLPFYEGFTKRSPEDRTVAARQANYLYRIGYITSEIGSKDEAIRRYQEAAIVVHKLGEVHPNVAECETIAADAYIAMGDLQRETGKLAESLRSLETAQEIFGNLNQAHPKEPQYLAGLAQAHHNFARLYSRSGKLSECRRHLEKALEIRAKLCKDHPDVAEYQASLAHTWNNLGADQTNSGDSKQALTSYKQASASWEQLSTTNPQNANYKVELAVVINNLGFQQVGMGLLKEALANYQRAHQLLQPLTKAHPEVTRYQELLASNYRNLGNLHSLSGKPKEALPNYQQARDILTGLCDAHPSVTNYQVELAGMCCNIGIALNFTGEAGKSLDRFDEALRRLEAVRQREPNHAAARTYLVNSLYSRAQSLNALERHLDAARHWDAAIGLDASGPRPFFFRMRALSLAQAGEYARASELTADTLLLQKLVPGSMVDLAHLYALLGRGANGDATRPLPEREKNAEVWARLALEMLKRADRAGAFKIQRIRKGIEKDKALDSLRGRDDFRRWKESLGK